ncbi:hypothetical protein OG203_17100 [Nocardia sp. NBC_01499]|uniref:DUF6924 domain-containing protein n=1 Tax=Nocardia sp. NBC_01499 TaxID=2903597 RepID=UPI00386E93A4
MRCPTGIDAWLIDDLGYRDVSAEQLRVIAEELWSIENNISLADMDWDEFASAADDDGIFRGF